MKSFITANSNLLIMCKNSVETKRLARSYYSSMAFASSIKNPRKVSLLCSPICAMLKDSFIWCLSVRRSYSTLMCSRYSRNCKLSCSISVDVSRRFMLTSRSILHRSLYNQQNTLMRARPHTTSIVRLKKKSKAADDLATDDTAKHSHALGFVCTEEKCPTTKCPELCAPLKNVYTKGFFTHKPIAGKFVRYISDKDANDKQDTQYYVKNPNKDKQVTAEKVADYQTKKEIKADDKMNAYIQTNDINNKLD